MASMNIQPSRRRMRVRQSGLVLIFTIILLVAMSLAALGLMRSILASNQVAGNLAFQQAAMQAADVGTQTAMAWLDQQARALVSSGGQLVAANRLDHNIAKSSIAPIEPIAYQAVRSDPTNNQNWEAFWIAQRDANMVNELPVNEAGFKVSYLIQRLCTSTGKKEKVGSNCEMTPYKQWDTRGSQSAGNLIPAAREALFRITVRVEGPRNSVSFTQTVVSI